MSPADSPSPPWGSNIPLIPGRGKVLIFQKKWKWENDKTWWYNKCSENGYGEKWKKAINGFWWWKGYKVDFFTKRNLDELKINDGTVDLASKTIYIISFQLSITAKVTNNILISLLSKK